MENSDCEFPKLCHIFVAEQYRRKDIATKIIIEAAKKTQHRREHRESNAKLEALELLASQGKGTD